MLFKARPPNPDSPFNVSLNVPGPVAVFREFSLNLETFELWRGGARVPLEPQPARLLALLVSRDGRPVSRAEAAACLWGEGTHVSQADGLHYAVRRIRLALGDDASSPAFVETLPRRGYRFLAPVHVKAAGPRARHRRALALAAAAALVVVIVESLPNSHHDTTVRLLKTLHAVLF